MITDLLESKKAVDIQTLDLRDKSLMCDYFVICSGTSNIHIRTLCDTLVLDGRKKGLKKRNVEGRANAKWILIDFKDIIVHIFDQSEREFYKLEELWENFLPEESNGQE
ncbi:MAG: ribosome silencing factor [Abditibacteriota bacterium]|nr:ribosome silencing factor [Abditibacteriota bacterium]